MFDDSNTINEKFIVGFIAFVMIVLAFIIDMISAYLGRTFSINKFIFDSFLWIVLGAFGIASVDKWINKNSDNKNNEDTNKDNKSNNNTAQ